jgi:hypothetical protein
MSTALVWVIKQLLVEVPYRRFGTTYRSLLQGSRIQEIMTSTRYVIAQKSTVLICFAVEALNHTGISVIKVMVP